MHWAHRVASRFPDGQLYANLRGFDPTGPPSDPSEVLRGFLRALGVPDEQIPTGLDEQSALYRSVLVDKRVLVLLDNAGDAEQIRPMLPGAASSLVVVTSRNQMPGLVAVDGAHPLPLDLLTLDEARDLLQQRLGKRRVADEPDAVDDIIDGCARLPLALAIVAARAALQPRLPLRTLATELRPGEDRLSALDGDDRSADVRAVFSWSYRRLGSAAGRLFRLLGTHPGPDLTAAAAASLAALPLTRVRPLLAELIRATLMVESVPGRYTSHDLLRAYAIEQARASDRDECAAATARMFDHYLHTAYAANRLVEPAREPLVLAPPRPGVRAEPVPDRDAALAWFDAEHPIMVRLITATATAGHETYVWQLAWTVLHHIFRRGGWKDAEAIQHKAIEAGQRLGDPVVEARDHCNLASVYARQDRVDEASGHLLQALDLSARAGDQLGQAHAHYTLAYLDGRLGRYTEALPHVERARDLYQALGHRHTYAHAVNGIGWLHAQLGEYERSLSASQQALAVLEDLEDRLGQASTWQNAGFAHHHLGHHSEAVASYQCAIQIHQDMGDRDQEATSLAQLGDTFRDIGDLAAARRVWRQALDILEVIEHADIDGEQLRTKLADLETNVAPATTGWGCRGAAGPAPRRRR